MASAVEPDAPLVLEVRGLLSPQVRDVSFQLRQGEILGVAGLMGAGRTELARLIVGADKRISGDILVHGQLVDIHQLTHLDYFPAPQFLLETNYIR